MICSYIDCQLADRYSYEQIWGKYLLLRTDQRVTVLGRWLGVGYLWRVGYIPGVVRVGVACWRNSWGGEGRGGVYNVPDYIILRHISYPVHVYH